MALPEKFHHISVEKYLADEERASVRSEYVDGQVFAMSGGTSRHALIISNLHAIIHMHVKGSRCRTYAGNFKVKVEAANSFYYPDVMVSCDHIDDKTVFTAKPTLIVEVLSPSTAVIDRREKVIAYKQIESLAEYLIVHQRKMQVQLHRRNDRQGWDILEFGPGAELLLTSIPAGPLKIPIEAIYEGVQWQHDNEWQVREDSQDESLQEEWQDQEECEAVLDW